MSQMVEELTGVGPVCKQNGELVGEAVSLVESGIA